MGDREARQRAMGGKRRRGIGQAGNRMPALRASLIRRSRTDALSPSVAVIAFAGHFIQAMNRAGVFLFRAT